MLRNLSLKTKIFSMTTIVVILSFLVLSWFVTSRSINNAKNVAYYIANQRAEQYKSQIRAELQGARVTSETLKVVFETLKDHDLTDRDMMNDILKRALAQKEYITAFCIAYEPNALDGRDAEFAGQGPQYDETGRFAPYWNKLGDSIAVEPLYDIDIADWYRVPRETLREYITDPYPYQVQGKSVMLASLIFPIVHQGQFIGIIASDIVLDKLQEMVTAVDADGWGGDTEILSSTGVIVAHPETAHLGKDIGQTGFLSPEEAEKIKEAIGKGEMYSIAGAEFYTLYMPIEFSEDTRPWSVAVRVPMSRVLKNAGDIRNDLIILSVGSVLVIAAMLYAIARGVTKPILMLAGTAKRYGNGELDLEIPQSQGQDEISVLSRAFGVMATKNRELISGMQAYAGELEEKNLNLKRLNEQLLLAKERAEKSSRAKSDFLSNMSHEMRTPMNAVIGMTSIGRSAEDVEHKDYAFGKIKEASTHLLGVINDILDMSKIESGKLELAVADFALDKMVRKVLNIIWGTMEEKKLGFHLEMDYDMPKGLVGDDQRLAQVIANLLSNAVKFTPEGGDITLRGQMLGEEDGICTLLFEVQDTGIGISREQQSRLFHSFEQADNSTSRKYGGTGLGLVISKRIVEIMGGDIWIESELGRGATFAFTVRLARGDSGGNALAQVREKLTGASILVAEPSGEIREIFQTLAERENLHFDFAADGREAKALMESGSYGLCFADWALPDMDGAQLAGSLREKAGELSVAIMGTSGEYELAAGQAKEAGAGKWLFKPVFFSDIIGWLQACLCGGESQEEGQAPVREFVGHHVLLAEDVEINREIVLSMLAPTKLVIDCAENGAQALSMFQKNPQRYSMIFMDIQMPEMDGLEAATRIRGLELPEAKTIPIIAMTANVFKEDVERCMAAGMNGHLGKPLDIEAIYEKLNEYLG